MTATGKLFPVIEPYKTGYLAVSSIHQLYFEECGNPDGVPIVVLHGGPGSGCNPGQRRYFDPAHYRIVLFDQRGSGRSKPAGCIEENTTQLLVADIERLREQLNISKWLVFGGSWGCTLALSYAVAYHERIQGLILRGVFLARSEELHWFLYDVRHFFPEAWAQFISVLDDQEQPDILAGYTKLLIDGDAVSQTLAAKTWSNFETAIMTLLPATTTPIAKDEAMVNRLKVHLHYLLHDCFLRGTPLLANISTLRNIPTIIVQGRYDMVCPVQTAHTLHRAWPEAEFNIIANAGHSGMEPGIASALVDATEKFKLLR